MTTSESDERSTSVGVVIPLRSLRNGKLRLGEVMTAEPRSELIRSMADAVVRAAHDLPVLIVYDDPEVASWAERRGADALQPTVPGLDAAVSAGRAHMAAAGFDRIIVAHADLPRARDLRPVADFDGITIVPDRLRDGTNVLCVPALLDFAFAYGPGSFENHRRIAARSGVAVRVLEDDDLALDVDHPDDLSALESRG